jgi:two-component system LytT family response regulator
MNPNLDVHVGSRTFLSPDNVVMIKADIAYSMIYLSDGSQMLVSTHLLRLQQRFGKHLVRIHRSYLVNPNFLEIVNDTNLQTINGLVCPMSRRMKGNLITQSDN